MATTRKKTTSTPRKSTSAGRKTRTSTRRTTKAAAAAADALQTETPVAEQVAVEPDAPTAQDADVAAEAVEAASPTETDASGDSAADATTDDKSDMVRRPDLIQAVAERSNLKRSDTKMVIDLVLEEIGKALDAKDEVSLKPLGKFSVKKRNDGGNGAVLTLKLKRDAGTAQQEGETPLADPDAES